MEYLNLGWIRRHWHSSAGITFLLLSLLCPLQARGQMILVFTKRSVQLEFYLGPEGGLLFIS